MAKRALLITVAGKSTRFSKSLGYEVLKSIYEEEDYPSILERIMSYSKDLFDEIIIVGGYKYDELKTYAKDKDWNAKTVLNTDYEKGSLLSMLCGLKEISHSTKELVFIEGDVAVDYNSFIRLVNTSDSVIGYTNQIITSNKSVVYYKTLQDDIKYYYDSNHKFIHINEAFKSIVNSAQLWKFSNLILLNKLGREISNSAGDYTNLVLIEKYFRSVGENFSEVLIENWFNCNEVNDYKQSNLILKR